jgi:hypothetical protein
MRSNEQRTKQTRSVINDHDNKLDVRHDFIAWQFLGIEIATSAFAAAAAQKRLLAMTE